jgi:hypothetical protein
MTDRSAILTRNTKETQITASMNLDGTGVNSVSTGLPFFDHMLDQLGRHGGIDLTVAATGDLHIDASAGVEGQVQAGEVTINGNLQGNIANARHVELKQGGLSRHKVVGVIGSTVEPESLLNGDNKIF